MGVVRESLKDGSRQMAISRGVTKIPSCLRRREIEEEERNEGEEKERERRKKGKEERGEK